MFKGDYEKAYEILNDFTFGLLELKLKGTTKLSAYQKLHIRCVIAILNEDNDILRTILQRNLHSQLSIDRYNADANVRRILTPWDQLLYLSCRAGNLTAFKMLMEHPATGTYALRWDFREFRGLMSNLNWCPLFDANSMPSFEEIVTTSHSAFEGCKGRQFLGMLLGYNVLVELVSIKGVDFCNSYLIHQIEPPKKPREYYRHYLSLIKQAWRNPDAHQIIPVLVECIERNEEPFNVWNPMDNIVAEKEYRFEGNPLCDSKGSSELIGFISKYLRMNIDNFSALIKGRIEQDVERNVFIIFYLLMTRSEKVAKHNDFLQLLLKPDNEELLMETVDLIVSYDNFNDIQPLLQENDLDREQLLVVMQHALRQQGCNILSVLLVYAEQKGLAFSVADVVESMLKRGILQYELSEDKLQWLQDRGIDFNNPIVTEGQPRRFWLLEFTQIMRDYPKQIEIFIDKCGTALDTSDDEGKNILHYILNDQYIDEKMLAKIIQLIKQKNLLKMLSQPDKNGDTPLHCLCSNKSSSHNNHHKIAALLIANGADVSAKNNKQQLPVSLNAEDQYIEVDTQKDFFITDPLKRKVSLLRAFGLPIFDAVHGCRKAFSSVIQSNLSMNWVISLFDIERLFEDSREFFALRNFFYEELLRLEKVYIESGVENNILKQIFPVDDNIFSRILEVYRPKKVKAGRFFWTLKLATEEQAIIFDFLKKSPVIAFFLIHFEGNFQGFYHVSKMIDLDKAACDDGTLTKYCMLLEHVFSMFSMKMPVMHDDITRESEAGPWK